MLASITNAIDLNLTKSTLHNRTGRGKALTMQTPLCNQIRSCCRGQTRN